MEKSVIAFGSNKKSEKGDARETVEWSLKEVSFRANAPLTCSSFYQTPAFPAGAGPDFVNVVAVIPTQMPAAAFLALLHQIEAEAGRERTKRWGQRTLDIDLIAHGEMIAPDLQTFQNWYNLPADAQTKLAPEELILPHPRVQDRAFVLVPLCEVAPDWVHPVLGQTARVLCDKLPAADRASVVALDR